MAKANASNFKRKMRNLQRATEAVNDTVMLDAAEDVVDDIAVELASIDTSTQVGFDADLFIQNLRQTLDKDETGAWTIDPWEAGGDEEDFEQIAGKEFGPVTIGDHSANSLWHAGTGRYADFWRLIHSNAAARFDLATLRQEVWGDKTPQWYLLNYGFLAAGQEPTHFLENALDRTPISRVRTAIKRRLQEGYR